MKSVSVRPPLPKGEGRHLQTSHAGVRLDRCPGLYTTPLARRGRAARLLGVGLLRCGSRCVVFARRGGAFAQRMAAEGFEVVAFRGGRHNPLAFWQIRRALRRIRPQVLHYNDPHSIIAAGVASMGMYIPAKLAARRVDFSLRSPRPYRTFCDRVVCVSQAVRRVCQQGGLPEAMLRVVHERGRSGSRCSGQA